jgi:tRNA(Ile)-lysidine synthetase-like protein
MSAADTFVRTIQQHFLIPQDSLVLVAVSGGADSLALLHLLRQHQATFGCRLHVATLDHGLRGEAGAADARFVMETAQTWDLEATAGQVDVLALAAESRLGTEAAARLARYQFLAEVARKVGAGRIALAHHADDQAETVLMHLLRGTGIEGLAAMTYQSPHPTDPDLLLLRPLLGLTRAAIEAYCVEHELMPRHDVSNEDTAYTRNRLRHEVLPYLETLYPQVKRSLVQLADVAALEDELVRTMFEKRILPHVTRTDVRVRLARSVFNDEHRALQRRFVRWAAAQLGLADDLAYAHIVAAVQVMLRGEVGAVALLPGGLQARLDYEAVVVERVDAPVEAPEKVFLLTVDQEIPVHIPGITPLGGGWRLHAVLCAGPVVWSESGRPQTRLALAVEDRPQVTVRTRREGDTIEIGSGHTQKVTQWMSDVKIPKALRDYVPLLVVHGQVAVVLWNHSWKVSERFKAGSGADSSSLDMWLENSYE